jgi:hypothetical protein
VLGATYGISGPAGIPLDLLVRVLKIKEFIDLAQKLTSF